MVYTLFFPSIAKRISEGTIVRGDSVFEIIAKYNNQFNSLSTIDFVFKYIPDSDFTLENGQNMILFFIDGTSLTGNGFMITLYNNSGTLQLKLKYDNGSGWTDSITLNIPTTSTPSYNNSYYVAFQYRNPINNRDVYLYITEFKENASPETKTSADASNNALVSGVNSSAFTQFGFGAPSTTNLRYSPTVGEYEVDGTGQLKNLSGYFITQNVALLYLKLWGDVIPVNASAGTYGLFNTTNVADQNTVKEYSIYYMAQIFSLLPEPAVGQSGAIPDLEFQLDIPQDTIPFINADANPQTNISNRSKDDNSDTSVDQLATIIKDNSNSYQTLENWVINSNTTIVSFEEVNCILKGTKILTPDGYKLIEEIKVGDFIITHDGREKKIIKTHFNSAIHNKKTQCIIIKKGTFGAEEDLFLSKNHAILIGDEFIIPDRKMPDKISYLNNKSHYTYYSLMTDDYLRDSLVANGVPIETWGGYLPHIKNFKYKDTVLRNNERNRILKKID